MPISSTEQYDTNVVAGEEKGMHQILIGVDATKELSSVCFSWVLKNVARPGDSIIVLGILHRIVTPMGYKSKADLSAFVGPNKRALEAEIISKMALFEKVLQPLSDLCDKLQVHLDITITAGTPMKAVLMKEALKISPTHVVLDRNLRKDKRFYKEHLYCDLFVFSQSNQVEHLHSSNDQLPQKVAVVTHMKGSNFHSQATPLSLLPDQVEGSKGPFLSGRSSEADLETPMFSPGPELCRSTSSSSKSSENFFIDLCLQESSEGVVPVWSFEDPDTAKSYPTSSFTPSYKDKAFRAGPEKSSLASPLQLGHETSHVETLKEKDDLIDEFVEQKRQLPLLKELFKCPEHEIYGSATVEERRADLIKSEEKLMVESHKLHKHTCESIAFDVGKKHDSRSSSLHLDNSKSLKLQRDSIHGGAFTEPPPLCSVCKLEAPDFGRSPKIYREDEIKAATNNFSAANLIAEGGFGFVYKGLLQERLVAIKKLKLSSLGGDAQFSAEVEALSYAQHMNLVRLVGFCLDVKEHALVYEYVCNGSLDQHLSGENSCNLKWPSRFKIALGAAKGLRYLHEECRVGCIVHRDMRPSNILVTHDFTAMVGDFGLAKIASAVEGQDETRAISTLGYAAPEFIESKLATSKTDVYSYGVVLLELITGRRAVDFLRPKGETFLTEWARSRLDNNKIDDLLDKNIAHSVDKHELDRMLKAAALCITKNPKNRPGISQIIRILEGDSDKVEGGMWQLHHFIKPTSGDPARKSVEAIEEVDTSKLHQSTARTTPKGNSVNRNWRGWVKTK